MGRYNKVQWIADEVNELKGAIEAYGKKMSNAQLTKQLAQAVYLLSSAVEEIVELNGDVAALTPDKK